LQNLLKLEEPYDRDAGLWEPDVRTPTRLGEARVVFRLARSEGGDIVPWYPHEDPRRAWALSEVSVRAARLKGAVEDAAVEGAKTQWPAWDREIPVLLLRPGADGAWRGNGIDPRGQRLTVTYDTSHGLMFGS